MSARTHRCRQPLKYICATSRTLKEVGSFLGAFLLFLFDLMVLVSGFVQTVSFLIGKRPTLNEICEVVMLPADWRAALIFPPYIPE